MRVLLTRPLREAQASAARLSVLGHEAVIAPVLMIVPLASNLAGHAGDAVVVTSAHAVEFLAATEIAALSAVPAFAVGERSAEAARRAGFGDVRAGQGDEVALAGLIASALPAGSNVLYLAGRERKGDLPRRLRDHGLACRLVETYDAVAAPALDVAAVAALAAGRIDAVLHYSARSARLFLKLANAAGLQQASAGLLHACLSPAVAARLVGSGAAHVAVAARPEEAALFVLLSAETVA